jgi:hypothetical protein
MMAVYDPMQLNGQSRAMQLNIHEIVLTEGRGEFHFEFLNGDLKLNYSEAHALYRLLGGLLNDSIVQLQAHSKNVILSPEEILKTSMGNSNEI